MADRPRRADARRNRERVLAAAREAFAESGYAAALDDIAARAGVGPGTVYRHFPTKEALFEAVTVARVEDLVMDARARAAAEDPGTALTGFLARLAEEGGLKRDVTDALSLPGPLVDELHAAIGALLTRAQQVGAVRDEIGLADLVALLKALLATVQDSDGPGLRERVFAVLIDGLRPPRS